MSRDPILDELRANRDAIASEHGYDLDAIFGMLCELQNASPREHVSPTPPNVTPRREEVQRAIEPDSGLNKP